MSHTPGPWYPDDNGEVDTSAADLSTWDGVLAGGEVVAYCHPDNVPLIAAAPDMKAVLEMIGCTPCPVQVYAWLDETGINAARLAALAKAEGKA